MKIQSMSILVPSKKCVNDCAFCVSKMHGDKCLNQIEGNWAFTDLYVDEYVARMNYARDNGCNALMLTGNSEPQQNRAFLERLGFMLRMMKNPFYQIEMQTTGVMLDDKYLRFLRNWVNVNVISVSVSAFDDEKNAEYIGMQDSLKFNLEHLCHEIKRYDFVLRLSINLTDAFEDWTPEQILEKCKALGANQVTFRQLYTSGKNTPQDNWIGKHALSAKKAADLYRYVHHKLPGGEFQFKAIQQLEYGGMAHNVDGMSVVYDDDCMATKQEEHDALKYVILKPDCHIYGSWEEDAPPIF